MATLRAPVQLASGNGTQLVTRGSARSKLLVQFANHHSDYVTVKVAVLTGTGPNFATSRSAHSRSVPPGESGSFYVPTLSASENLVGWASVANVVTLSVDDGR